MSPRPLALAALLALALAPRALAQEKPAPATPTATGDGFQIQEVAANSPLATLGLRAGDVIISINGHPASRADASALYEALKSETEIALEIERPGEGRKTLTISFEHGRMTRKEPPPQPAAPEGEDPQYAEMSKAVGITPEQAPQVKKIIAEGQDEFERRLAEITRSSAVEVQAIEKLGDAVAKKTEERILEILTPEQKPRFKAYLKEKEALRDREEGGK